MNAQELKQQIQDRVAEIAALTDETRRSEAMKTHLDTMSRFYNYSLGNVISIMLHRPDASYVAGYTTWQKMNRFVKRGEHGIPILAPMVYKQGEEGKEREEGAQKKVMGFKTVYVFDISQTDGQELPMLQWADDEREAWLNESLLKFAESKSISVEFKDIEGSARGYSTGGKIVISNQAGTDTLVHEIAHELLNHRDHTTATATAEIEAESVAYVVCKHFGVNLIHAINYITLWSDNAKEITDRLGRITKCATEIIQFIDSPKE